MADDRMDVIDPHHAAIAQSIFCAKNGIDREAPIDGVCSNCGENIYDTIKVKDAASKMVVGCPVCGAIFED